MRGRTFSSGSVLFVKCYFLMIVCINALDFLHQKVYFNVLGSYAKQITFQSIKIQSKRSNVAFLNVSAISF